MGILNFNGTLYMKYLLIMAVSIVLACQSDSENMQDNSLSFLALGDSYTIGHNVEEDERWPVQLASHLNDRGVEMGAPKIIATTGWRTDQLKAAIEADTELKDQYDLVSLLIGVNNQYQRRTVASFLPEFKELMQTAIQLAGSKDRVIVLSIPDYGVTPFGQSRGEEKVARELDEYNRASKEVCDREGIRYFDITPISRVAKTDPELIASDNLHPSGKMYSQWVDLIIDDVAGLFQE